MKVRRFPAVKGESTERVTPHRKIAGGQSGTLLATAGDCRPAFVFDKFRKLCPTREDFESTGPGLIPGGWTNTQLRYVTTKLDDGNTVLMKTARIAVPFYRQWYAFIGTPDMAATRFPPT